jgi:hypothetical protein
MDSGRPRCFGGPAAPVLLTVCPSGRRCELEGRQRDDDDARFGGAKLRRAKNALESGVMRRWLVLIAVVGVAAAWTYSQVEPDELGSCHRIALYVGHVATASDCEPYDVVDLGLVVGAMLAVGVVLSGGRVTFSVPGVGDLVLSRQAREAADDLRSRQAETVERLAAYRTFRESLVRAAEQGEHL